MLANSRFDKLLGLEDNSVGDNSYRMRFLTAFGKLFGKDIISKLSRSRNPSYVLSMDSRLRKPRYDFPVLWESWQHSWSLEAVSRAITQEIMRNGWENVPKFKVKCESCSREYEETVEKCGCGKSKLIEPENEQLVKANKITTKPNEDWTFSKYLRSLIEYELGLGNEYISFGRRVLGDIERLDEWYVEDSRFIIPMADVYNRLGNPRQYFCPYCWDKGIEALGRVYDKNTLPYDRLDVLIVDALTLPVEQRNSPECKICGRKLIQTAYVELVNGRIQARWGKNEMIHDSMEQVAPHFHGVSKLVVLWKVVETLLNMDDYNWEMYSKGQIGKFMEMPGYDEHEIAQVKTRIEQELQSLDKRDVQTGNVRLSKKIRVVLLGGKRGADPLRSIPFMPDPKQMQSFEYYMLYWQAINAVYGVQAIFTAMMEKGATGSTPVLQIRVNDRATKDYQTHFENFIMKLYEKFEITDWMFKFKKIEERDELRDSQVEHTKAATALTWVNAGFTVKINDLGELEVTGEGKVTEARSRVQEPRTSAGGAPTGVSSVRPDAETRESPSTGELVQRIAPTTLPAVRLPMSWESLTIFEAFDRKYEVGNADGDVFLRIDGVEVPETRINSRNFHYIIGSLVGRILDDAVMSLPEVEVENFYGLRNGWVMTIRREYNSETLKEVSNYLENVGLMELARKFDNLRDRLDRIMLSSTEEHHVE